MAFFQVETKDYLIHSSVTGEHQTSPDICHLSTTWTPMLVIPMLQLSNSKINSISIFLLVDCFIPVLSGLKKKKTSQTYDSGKPFCLDLSCVQLRLCMGTSGGTFECYLHQSLLSWKELYSPLYFTNWCSAKSVNEISLLKICIVSDLPLLLIFVLKHRNIIH